MNNYLQINFEIQSSEQAEILIAILSESGFEGFEEGENKLNAFIPEMAFDEAALRASIAPFSLTFSKQLIASRNWNEEWEKDFAPVIVDDFCAIRASFHPSVSGVENEIIITPKMSFGTGHHPTTYLMVEAMQQIHFSDRTVFDFGTGTGVLAILAEKLGAANILAIDMDDWSIENAKENISVNGCTHIKLEKSTKITETRVFDIILANINRNVIIEQLPFLRQQLSPEGVLLVSGLLNSDLEAIRLESSKNEIRVDRLLQKDNWICLFLSPLNS